MYTGLTINFYITLHLIIKISQYYIEHGKNLGTHGNEHIFINNKKNQMIIPNKDILPFHCGCWSATESS